MSESRVRRYVLGTAGHVDHGKTTLVHALTGVDTDRLPDEKRRGITIELGFAPLHLGEGLEVSVIDVPGHRRLVHTMIAGAVGMELVLLVVAADEGVMPQTREHVAACELLGLRRVVVAVTKLDRASPDLAALAGEEALELLGDRFEASVVACSARTGEGIDALRAELSRAISRLGPPRDTGRARLSVDRVFSIKGAGTVVTGTLVEGKIAVGAPLAIVSAKGVISSAARGLQVHDRAVDQAHAPTRLAVNLAGVAREDITRGDVVTDDAAARLARTLDVELKTAGGPLRDGASVQVYIGTARAPAKLVVVEDAGAVVRARLRLAQPLVAFGGDRLVLRGYVADGPAGAVVGGGVVLDADPPRRRPRAARDARAPLLAALGAGDASHALRALVDEAAPKPLLAAALASRFSIDAAALRRAADQLAARGEVTQLTSARSEGGAKGRLVGWASPAAVAELATRARALVAAHHARAPLDPGLALETLRSQLGVRAGADVAEAAIALAAAENEPKSTVVGAQLVVAGGLARAATFGGAAPKTAAAGGLAKVLAALVAADMKGLTEHAAGVASGATPREVKAILANLVRTGGALHAGDLWFPRASYDALRGRVEELLAREGRLTIAAFKELSGLGRRQAMPLLEQLDRDGVTRREGDDRLPPGRG